MNKKQIYNKIFKHLVKASILFLIIMFCSIFFFTAKRTKGPRVAITLMDSLKDAEIDPCLFDALEESFVPKENIKELTNKVFSEDESFLYIKILPKYQPLIDPLKFLPLEMWLYKDKEIIPYKENDFSLKDEASWHFTLDEKKRLLYLDARDMYLSKDAKYAQKLNDGMLLAANSHLYSVVELPAGLKEFKINAEGKCVIVRDKKIKDFDYSAGMKVSLDDKVLGEVFVEEGKIAPFTFNACVPPGWHKIEVAFTNDIWNPEKGWDRNLLVKDVEIFNLSGSVYLRIKKGMEEKFLSKNYSLSYFQALDDEEKNNLIYFFKNKFNVNNLKDIVLNDNPPSSLIKDVEINGLIKRAIFAPAPTKIKLKIKVPVDGIRLIFDFGIMEEAWDKTGDGVEFKVRLDTREDEPEDILFSKYINPKQNESDRRWFQGEVDLRRLKGKEINLIFETRGSPVSPITPTVDNSNDWAVWSE